MSKLILLVGPAGSGKSTYAKKLINEDGDHGAATVYINQDSQGKAHLAIFMNALAAGFDIIVDRMNFNVEQRKRYLEPAKKAGYETEIIVLHESYDTCLSRMLKRVGHETIQDETSARSALQLFFTKYERPIQNEADKITFTYPEGLKPQCIIVDLDGTLADCEHRRHFVRRTDGQKKDWVGFFKGMSDDKIIKQVHTVLGAFDCLGGFDIVLCTGRPDDYKKITEKWLEENKVYYDNMFMRRRHDSREDSIIKEIILDFEILTRYTPFISFDDRQQVVDMWRRRGLICFQVAEGNF